MSIALVTTNTQARALRKRKGGREGGREGGKTHTLLAKSSLAFDQNAPTRRAASSSGEGAEGSVEGREEGREDDEEEEEEEEEEVGRRFMMPPRMWVGRSPLL